MPQIGDIVYQFDGNRRVYERDADGRAKGAPIYREYFRPFRIVGENKRSWILCANLELEIEKAIDPWPGKTAKTRVMTVDEVEADCWKNSHVHRISEAVRCVTDIEILKQIAAMIVYDAQ